jgi:hypothetical protein
MNATNPRCVFGRRIGSPWMGWIVPTSDIPSKSDDASLLVVASRRPDLRRAHRFGHSEEHGDALTTATR